MRGGRRALVPVLAIAALAAPRQGAVAQETDSAASPPPAPAPRPSVWVRPATSLLVPGSGQLLAGQGRGAVYVAVEAYSLVRILRSNDEGRREGDRYRDLAFDVARRAFSPLRRDTVFEYFETMERFLESGLYDRDPGPALLPEIDAATYNGSIWLLARRTFWPDPELPPDPGSPEYLRAVRFYQDNAVGPNFQWTWRDASLEHGVFRESIRKSDTAFRRAQSMLGVLLANHVVSAVDALISSRLSAAAGRRAALQTTVGPTTELRLSLEF